MKFTEKIKEVSHKNRIIVAVIIVFFSAVTIFLCCREGVRVQSDQGQKTEQPVYKAEPVY